MTDIITPEQCRAARALLNWSQSVLELKSGVARKTLADFEGNKKERPLERTLMDVRTAFEEAGIRFVDENGDGPGVRLRRVIWKLSPINPNSQNWKASSHCGEVLIRAATEDRARKIAALALNIAVDKEPGAQIISPPWKRQAKEATCERVMDTQYPEEGEDEILEPAEYDHEWQR